MRKLTILALTAVFVMATATFALACDGKADAASAKAKTEACASKADAATASAKGACGSKADAATASAKGACASKADAATASAEGACGSKADAATASAQGACGSKADAATASAKGACGADCTKPCCADKAGAVKSASAKGACSSTAETAMAVAVETVRMPSGDLAIFYNGANEATVAHLQASADKGMDNFVCGVVKGIAADEHCKAEMAKTERGVMVLVHADDASVIEKYEAEFAAMTAGADEEKSE